MNIELIKTLQVGNQLGEGITWHPQQKTMWWTDINGQKLFRYHLEQDRIEQCPVPERVGCFGFVENSERLIIAFESGLAFYNVANGEIEWLGKPETQRVGNRFNDGKIGPDGSFWAGAMVEQPRTPEQVAGLYRVDANGSIEQALDGFKITNGLCWSPDGSIMYHADSPSRKIYRYNADLSGKQLFAETDSNCVPDGSTVDSQGFVWNAQWGGNKVVRYTPEGEVSFVLEVPFSQPTCVAFGGPNLDLLFVTSAKQGDTTHPEAGNVLIYQTDVVGLECSFFKGV